MSYTIMSNQQMGYDSISYYSFPGVEILPFCSAKDDNGTHTEVNLVKSLQKTLPSNYLSIIIP